MAPSMKSKVDKIFEKSEAKAAQMTEEEINARLGPATRRFFAIAEGLENRLAMVFPNSGTKIVLWITFWLIGSLCGRIILPLFKSLPELPLLPLGFASLLGLGALWLGIKTTKNNSSLRYYVAWLLLALNALRTSNGDIDNGIIFGAGLLGHYLGWMLTLMFSKQTTKG